MFVDVRVGVYAVHIWKVFIVNGARTLYFTSLIFPEIEEQMIISSGGNIITIILVMRISHVEASFILSISIVSPRGTSRIAKYFLLNFDICLCRISCTNYVFFPEITLWKIGENRQDESRIRERGSARDEEKGRGLELLWGTALWSPFKLWPSMLSSIASQTCSPPGFKLCSKCFSSLSSSA